MPNSPAISTIATQSLQLFKGFAVIMLLSIFAGLAFDMWYLAGIPAFLILVYMTIIDFRKIFFFLLICIPLSTEFYLPNGLGTDLPTEPLMVGLMMVYGIYVLRHGREMDSSFIKHPLTLILVFHLFWIFAATITSSLFIVSLKFSLAKLWYVTVFFFMAGSMLKDEKNIKNFFWCILIPLLFTVVIVLVRHAGYGFTFEAASKVLSPFYRNHVNYAALLALFIPFVWFARQWYPSYSTKRYIINAILVILLLAIQFSYTRAAYVTLILAIGAYYIIKFKLVKVVLLLSILVVLIGFSYMYNKNTYLDYAPDYKNTIVHSKFDNLVEATINGEDVSTMERFYRWIAGFRMAAEKPITGFGPGNFYNFYKSYTVSSFETYVSDNPEKSGIHSYFLLMMVEQGFVGMIIFIALSFYALIKGEQVYHESRRITRKGIVMGAILSLVVINAFLLINDMIETDKMGTFFFMNLALIINMDIANKSEVRGE
ncbi:MAG: O-antigen ligase [Saprospiraceae bacterium]|jgi:O-antigen ligase